MAKRRPADQSLFDNLEPDDSPAAGRDAAIRSTLLSGGGTGPGSTANVALTFRTMFAPPAGFLTVPVPVSDHVEPLKVPVHAIVPPL